MRVDKWLTISEAAKLAGVHPRTMRRRLRYLHSDRPQLGLLSRFGARKTLVSANALQRVLTTDPALSDAELESIHSRLHQIDQRVAALRQGYRRLERRLPPRAATG